MDGARGTEIWILVGETLVVIGVMGVHWYIVLGTEAFGEIGVMEGACLGLLPGLLPASGTTCEFVAVFRGKNESRRLPPFTRSVFALDTAGTRHFTEQKAGIRKGRNEPEPVSPPSPPDSKYHDILAVQRSALPVTSNRRPSGPTSSQI